MKDLSIIILSYNTSELTHKTLLHLGEALRRQPNLKTEIIVVDNASTDNSQTMLKKFAKTAEIVTDTYSMIFNKKNVGFGAGNNIGIKKAKGIYTLLLNSDVLTDEADLRGLVDYMDNNPNVGALTPRVELPDGNIDPASHRGFPTIWHSFCYYTKLESIFKHIPVLNRIFGGYHLTHMDLTSTHEIDSPTAAFMIIRTDLLKKLKGFDEAFFMYGEDLDLSYRIKEAGYKIMYHPICTVTHLKHQSGLKKNESSTQSKTQKHFYDAMKIFYDKHYADNNPQIINQLIHKAIDIKSQL